MTKIYNRHCELEKRLWLRKNCTKAEEYFWDKLKNRQISGFKFRRQYSVYHFVLDFYSPKLKLAIEIDGDYHLEPEVQIYDKERQEFIEALGIKFLRFTNDEIFNEPDKILHIIEVEAKKKMETK